MRAGLRRRVCDGINDKGDVKGHPLSNGLTAVGTGHGIGDGSFKGIGFTHAAGGSSREDLYRGRQGRARAGTEGFFIGIRILVQ